MNIKKLTLKSPDYPQILRQYKGKPKVLYQLGKPLGELLKRPTVAIVGSRQLSPYGRQITEDLASKLAGQGIVIISGLAYGADAAAHTAAIHAGGLAIAVLPSPLDNIVPVNNRYLAELILEQGGALISEYGPGEPPFKQNFIARNRIMSGLADAVVITEAGEKSGALHTARFAFEQDKPVLAVPGEVGKPGWIGSNNLIKSNRAALAASYVDVLDALNLPQHGPKATGVRGRNANEQKLLDLMLEGVSEGEILLERSGLDVPLFSQTLTMLEISGKVKPLGANHWAIH